jgi:cyclophilin family peptidyl-prolyl cis-trans isomerase
VAGPAPDSFRVALSTSKGDVVVAIYKAWSPHGADRFYQLVSEGFFDEQRFFRVIPQYIAQFGASADPKQNDRWDDAKIPDDPRTQSNSRGTLSFAAEAPNTRSHQLFFNLKDNPKLDPQNFIPIGRVVEGMSVLDALYDDYGDTPKYRLVATLGNEYLHRMFPRMDYIKTARVVGAQVPAPAKP